MRDYEMHYLKSWLDKGSRKKKLFFLLDSPLRPLANPHPPRLSGQNDLITNLKLRQG